MERLLLLPSWGISVQDNKVWSLVISKRWGIHVIKVGTIISSEVGNNCVTKAAEYTCLCRRTMAQMESSPFKTRTVQNLRVFCFCLYFFFFFLSQSNLVYRTAYESIQMEKKTGKKKKKKKKKKQNNNNKRCVCLQSQPLSSDSLSSECHSTAGWKAEEKV